MRVLLKSFDITTIPGYQILPGGQIEQFHKNRTEITASVILEGSPEEAHALMEHRRDLEILPVDRVELAPNTLDLDVAKGDKIQYRFLRGARSGNPEAETSGWMTITKINGDQITVLDEKFVKGFEFVILKCQITALDPKKSHKIKVNAQERIDMSDLVSTSINDAAIRSTMIADGSITVVKFKDPLDSLRKQVEEFELV